MFKVKYGDDYLTDYVRFIKVNRGVASESELLLEENSGDGTKVLKSRRKAKEISMTFHVIDGLDVNVVREKLGKIISATETKQLIFSDNPNFYYEAILTGTIEYTDDGFNADGGFTLLVPKGYSESADTKVLNNDNSGMENGNIVNLSNSIKVLANNRGTLPAFPTVTITPTAESGFFALVSQNGVLEIGNPDEADDVRKTKQSVIADFSTKSDFDSNFVNDTSWSSSWATDFQPIPINSTLKWKNDGVRMDNIATSQNWNGGIQRYSVPKDSTGVYPTNWHAQFNTMFIGGTIDQCGRMQIYFCDENKKPQGMFEIYKGSMGRTAEIIFYLIGSDGTMQRFGGSKFFDAKTGKTPDGADLFSTNSGGQGIIKQGNKYSFYWKGVAYTFLMNDANSATKLAYIYVVEASRKGYAMIGDCSLRSFKLTNLNSGYMVDIINKYQPNDNIVIDMENKKITVNGKGANSDFITGSNFFPIDVGIGQEIDISYSNFTTSPPKINVEWRERIL